MRLQDLSYALRTVAEVAHSGEQLVGSLDRARPRGHVASIALGVGVGIGLGALLFSESARQYVKTWILGATESVQTKRGSTFVSTVASDAESHPEVVPPPH